VINAMIFTSPAYYHATNYLIDRKYNNVKKGTVLPRPQRYKCGCERFLHFLRYLAHSVDIVFMKFSQFTLKVEFNLEVKVSVVPRVLP